MKKWIAILAFCVAPFLASCVTAEIASCPPEDAVIGLQTPFGVMPSIIPEGAFDDRDNYMTKEEFDEEMEKQGGEDI